MQNSMRAKTEKARKYYRNVPNDIVVVPSDKTKKLVAMDKSKYGEILPRGTIETANYKEINELKHPIPKQIKFYTRLHKIINKYRDTDTAILQFPKNFDLL